MRQANGSGSAYKLKGKRRKPWVARVTNGWTIVDGKEKQHRQIIGYFEKKQEALHALLMHSINPVSPKQDITLSDLYGEWTEFKYTQISKSTVDNYKACWLYLKPLYSAKFKDIRTMHIQKIINECKKSSSTMEKIKALATMLYAYAMQNDIVNKNYAEFIVLPKTEKKDKLIYTDFEIKKLFDADRLPWVDSILILIYSGMRINEMLKLTKFDVDLKKRIITGGLKTDAGKNRTIPIHDKVFQYIKTRYDIATDYLFTNDRGKKISDDFYRDKYYYSLLDQLEIEKKSPHSCRHTCASLMSRKNVNTKLIQEIMGHADYAFTANEYTHPDIEELRNAVNMI